MAGAITVVVMVIEAVDLTTKDSAVTVASTAVAASMAAMDFMKAAGFTVAVEDSMEAVVSTAVAATVAGIANCQES